MTKKLKICLIIIVFVVTSCNTTNFSKNSLSVKEEYIEEIETNSFSLTSIENRQITSFSTSASERVTIKEPKSIGFKPFENEEYVSLEDFDFGDYFPMVKLMVPNSTRHPSLYDYSILNDNCSNLSDGKVLYEDVNSKYSLPLKEKQKNYYSSTIDSYIGKRRILKISEDGDKVLCATINDISESNPNDNIHDNEHIFEGIIEIFHEKSLVHAEKISKNDRISECLNAITYYAYEFAFGLQQTNLYDFYNSPSGVFIEQVLERNLLLIVMAEDFPESNDFDFYKNGDDMDNNDVYIINTDTSEQKYLGSYMFDSMISPDLKYIMYNRPNGEGSHVYFTKENRLEDMPEGFFVKNLETNQITYIPVEEYEVYSSVGWIKRDGLESLIK